MKEERKSILKSENQTNNSNFAAYFKKLFFYKIQLPEMIRVLIFTILVFSTYSVQSQKMNRIDDEVLASIMVNKTTEKIILDGQLNEAVWQTAKPATNFSQYIPSADVIAKGQTEVFMASDDKYLYIAAKCYTKGADFIVNSLKRDYPFFGTDNISFMLDTYSDKTNSFMFGINPYGVRREALVSGGGREGNNFAMSWDNKWDGDAKMYADFWIAEIAIPFSTLRFNDGAEKWRFNCYRYDTQLNEVSTWTNIPRNLIIANVGYMGDMVWEEPIQKQRKNVSLIPYVSGGAFRDFEDIDETKYNFTSGIGGDAKIGLTSGLNLDLTINPDFSQVEVDRQVTNLSRFEVFFPERRQFFLENADLFGSFGAGRVTPFFSRRIGVSLDTTTDLNVQNRILYGARLSGKINDRLRIGLLNTQTAAQPENDLPSFNYTVATVEQNVFDRSSVAFIFVNKQALKPENYGTTHNPYNRVAGVEYRLATSDNKWDGKLLYHQVFSPSEEKNKYFNMSYIAFNERKYRFEMAHLLVGNGYEPEAGFVTRKDMLFLSPEASYNIFPEDGKVTKHTIGFDLRHIYKLGQDDNVIVEDFNWIESRLSTFWDIQFLNSSRLKIEGNYDDFILLDDFDPTRLQADSIFLEGGSRHQFAYVGMTFSSDNRKDFSTRLSPTVGSFYNGIRAGINSSIRYRYKQYGTIALDVNYNYIKLEEPFVATNLWLIGPRLDLTFSKTLFLTTFVQYNNQLDNLNINARLQWRFQPASDFFLVFTDNYITDPFDQFGVRNRAFVAKMTYWFNI